MKVLETYRCVTVGNTLDSPSIHYAGNDSYLIHAVIPVPLGGEAVY